MQFLTGLGFSVWRCHRISYVFNGPMSVSEQVPDCTHSLVRVSLHGGISDSRTQKNIDAREKAHFTSSPVSSVSRLFAPSSTVARLLIPHLRRKAHLRNSLYISHATSTSNPTPCRRPFALPPRCNIQKTPKSTSRKKKTTLTSRKRTRRKRKTSTTPSTQMRTSSY